MRNSLFQLTYTTLAFLFLSFSAIAQEEEEERKVNKNGLHFFHQYSLEHSFSQFNNDQPLKGKTFFSIMPFFGVGLKKETPNFVFAFSSRYGFQRDNMTFSYAGKKLPGIYSMNYWSIKRQFALGFKLTPQQTFSFLLISSLNDYGMGTTPYGEKMNLRKLEQKDKLHLSMDDEPFLDFRLGFEYEFKPMEEQKLRLFFHIESSLKQRRVEIAPNHNLGIYEPYVLYYRFSVIGFGLRF